MTELNLLRLHIWLTIASSSHADGHGGLNTDTRDSHSWGTPGWQKRNKFFNACCSRCLPTFQLSFSNTINFLITLQPPFFLIFYTLYFLKYEGQDLVLGSKAFISPKVKSVVGMWNIPPVLMRHSRFMSTVDVCTIFSGGRIIFLFIHSNKVGKSCTTLYTKVYS